MDVLPGGGRLGRDVRSFFSELCSTHHPTVFSPSASACELTWNHWTGWEELPKNTPTDDSEVSSRRPDGTSSSTNASASPSSSSEVVGHYVLRPWWQRGLFTTTNLVAGIGLAAVLLGGRSRIVRKMFIVPDPAAGPKQRATERLLVIQSPLHPRNHGAVYPLQRTRLMHSADPHEMLVDLMDERGHYSVGLQRAAVAGQTLPPWEARKAMYKVWYGEKEGLVKFMESTKVQEAQ